MDERILKETLMIDFSKGLNDVVEELFWKDQHLHEEDCLYIKDTYFNKWYAIEYKYHYAGGPYIVKEGVTARFDLISDEEIYKELEAFFYE